MNEHVLMIICFFVASISLTVKACDLWSKNGPSEWGLGRIGAVAVSIVALLFFGSAVDEAMILIGGI